MAMAQARQAAEGVKIEPHLTEDDLELARRGQLQVSVDSGDGGIEPSYDDETRHLEVAEVIVTIASGLFAPE